MVNVLTSMYDKLKYTSMSFLLKLVCHDLNIYAAKYSSNLKYMNLNIISAVKRLIAIYHIQNKSFCLHNICVLFVFIMYLYI